MILRNLNDVMLFDAECLVAFHTFEREQVSGLGIVELGFGIERNHVDLLPLDRISNDYEVSSRVGGANFRWACSSAGQSSGLLTRGSGVRFPSRLPVFQIGPIHLRLVRIRAFQARQPGSTPGWGTNFKWVRSSAW